VLRCSSGNNSWPSWVGDCFKVSDNLLLGPVLNKQWIFINNYFVSDPVWNLTNQSPVINTCFRPMSRTNFGLCCLTPLSTIFQLYRGGQFYWWRKPEYPKKTTDEGRNSLKIWIFDFHWLYMVSTNNKTNLAFTIIRSYRYRQHWSTDRYCLDNNIIYQLFY
jgi:hypothetical protein